MHQVAAVADTLPFDHKYTSGVIAWEPEDQPTDVSMATEKCTLLAIEKRTLFGRSRGGSRATGPTDTRSACQFYGCIQARITSVAARFSDRTAVSKGVSSSWFLALASPPARSKTSAIAAPPARAAMCKGVPSA